MAALEWAVLILSVYIVIFGICSAWFMIEEERFRRMYHGDAQMEAAKEDLANAKEALAQERAKHGNPT